MEAPRATLYLSPAPFTKRVTKGRGRGLAPFRWTVASPSAGELL